MTAAFDNIPETILLRNDNYYKKIQPAPKNKHFQGPIRVLRLFLLCIVLPGLLIATPLYIRHKLYSGQLYPLAMSDMRLIDNRISTTWCQRQLIKVNATFNAYLLNEQPQIIRDEKPVSMIRELNLEDDMKEYWGFYLLKGSVVTVSTCTRWPGSSLTIIRGHKHLHECAYIGDDSSEEIDELMQQIKEKTSPIFKVEEMNNLTKKNDNTLNSLKKDENLLKKNDSEENVSAPDNRPDLMKRHRANVHFHHPIHHTNKINFTLSNNENIDEGDHIDGKIMKVLLAQLQEKTEKKNKRRKIPDNLMDKWEEHISKYKNQSVNQDEQQNLRFANEALKRQQKFEKKSQSSKEVIQDILETLDEIPQEKKDLILKRVTDELINRQQNLNKTFNSHNASMSVYKDANSNNYLKRNITDSENDGLKRAKRDIVLDLVHNLNQHDGNQNNALEENMQPDDLADHRGHINGTSTNDKSLSEFWSSFSSSEEKLLNCAGLILNLPLTAHRLCEQNRSNEDALGKASLPNRVTYVVPTNGYYFFVFNSENEVQLNYLRIQFDIQKTKYNVSNAVSKCLNSTTQCALKLNFFSNERLVLELPIRNNDSLWNEEFVVLSECEPRTSIYIVCVIAVPLFFLFFAFQ